MSTPLLSVRDLDVAFRTEDGRVKAVDGVSFDLPPGEVIAVVGESGSGKSVTALTLMGLTRGANTEISGTATFGDTELIGASDAELRAAIRAGVWRKPWGHGLAEGERETVRGMSQIGG